MIPFNIPPILEKQIDYVNDVIRSGKTAGDGSYTKQCCSIIDDKVGSRSFLTTSGTHALEMSANLCGITQGDEVIMSSFTFPSTANAFILRGATIKFVDIRPDTMNIDETLIEEAVTKHTKAIVPMHYGGVACDMAKITKIAEKYSLYVIEDAAQAYMATYRGQTLGSFGDFACFSFHATKNYAMGEGGAIIINRSSSVDHAEIMREKGTDRSKFIRGEIERYSWNETGSSYIPSELNAAYLYAQLEIADEINRKRLSLWELYYETLKPLEEEAKIQLAEIPEECAHNAHMFYIKLENQTQRKNLIDHLNKKSIKTAFHYVPLHDSRAGKKYGSFIGTDRYTTKESERLLRLPIFYQMTTKQLLAVTDAIYDYFAQ